MSSFWSLWVMFLVVLNLGITLFLFLWGTRVRIPTQADGTSGHVWAHGVLREGVRKLPRWWFLMSAGMFLAGFAYLALYPGFGASRGLLGWTSHAELARDVAANDARLDALVQRFDLYTVEQLSTDPAALHIGRVLFEDNCAACHGRRGTGNVALGAPDLSDSDWLYGGDGKTLTASIRGGRSGVMPPWSSLGEANVKNLAQYVLSLSGRPHDAAAAAGAEPIFKSTCAACHGASGTGNTAMGAPNLTDSIWLHGGSVADIEQTIRAGRQGHMPAWSPRLDETRIRSIAAYVYHLSHAKDEAPR